MNAHNKRTNHPHDDSDFLMPHVFHEPSPSPLNAPSTEEWSWEKAMEEVDSPKTSEPENPFVFNFEEFFGEDTKTERLTHLFQQEKGERVDHGLQKTAPPLTPTSSVTFDSDSTVFIPQSKSATKFSQKTEIASEQQEADWDAYEHMAHHGKPLRFSVNLWKVALYFLGIGTLLLGLYKQSTPPSSSLIHQVDQKIKSRQWSEVLTESP